MKHHVGKPLALLGALAFACASPPSDSEKLDPALSRFVLSSVPVDVPNPTFVDFGGKVHLVGWEVSPKQAKPGNTLSLELYWRSVKRLAPGFRLYTHLTGPDGKVHEFDDVGPLREAASGLPLSSWIPGMIYVDEQAIVVPELSVPVVTLSVGVKAEGPAPDAGEKAPEYKLEILSGVSDGREGALLARLATGVTRGGKGRKDKNLRRPPGVRPGDRRPGLPLGRRPMGGMPAMNKENPQ